MQAGRKAKFCQRIYFEKKKAKRGFRAQTIWSFFFLCHQHVVDVSFSLYVKDEICKSFLQIVFIIFAHRQ